MKKRKGLKQPKAKPSLKDQKKLLKKVSEFILHKVVSKDSKQGSSQMLMAQERIYHPGSQKDN